MSAAHHVTIGNLTVGNDRPLTLIAGPCALESRAHAQEMAHALTELTKRLGIGLVYKTSFDKANRTSLKSERGIGMANGLPILAELRERFGCPVLTDVTPPSSAPRSPRRSTSCRSRPSSAARPTCCWPRPRPGAPSTSRRASSWRPGT